ncbi:MAG: NosD domain-containing protein [Candidatus Jordarchaeaceae archaeon]
MKNVRINEKALMAAILAAFIITATILTMVTTINRNQNIYPLVSLYPQGISGSNTVIQSKMEIGENFDFEGNISETIVVTADNIVIDGHGYYLIGPENGTGTGFNLTNRKNVTIKNVIVTGWQYGFYLNNGQNNTLTNNAATNNNVGFYLHYSNNNTLSGNNANNNWDGFHLHYSSNNTLSDNNATNNNWYGFYLHYSNNNTLSSNFALNNTEQGYKWENSIDNDFMGSLESYYLRVRVANAQGNPITCAHIKVETDGVILYATSYFGGTDSTTDSNGLTPWIIVPYGIFTTNDTMTYYNNIVTVWYSSLLEVAVFSNNPRTVNMSNSHMENFIVASWQFTTTAMMLPVSFLVATRGGISPLIFIAPGVISVLATVVIYYFRKARKKVS